MDIPLQLTVENLLAQYVHAIDDDRLEDWPGFFVERMRFWSPARTFHIIIRHPLRGDLMRLLLQIWSGLIRRA